MHYDYGVVDVDDGSGTAGSNGSGDGGIEHSSGGGDGSGGNYYINRT